MTSLFKSFRLNDFCSFNLYLFVLVLVGVSYSFPVICSFITNKKLVFYINLRFRINYPCMSANFHLVNLVIFLFLVFVFPSTPSIPYIAKSRVLSALISISSKAFLFHVRIWSDILFFREEIWFLVLNLHLRSKFVYEYFCDRISLIYLQDFSTLKNPLVAADYH